MLITSSRRCSISKMPKPISLLMRWISSVRTFGLRNFSRTKSAKLVAMRFLLCGMMAVCGMRRPKGCRNSATTANQSAKPPTMAASAPAFTRRVAKVAGIKSVAIKTTIANAKHPSARYCLRRNSASLSLLNFTSPMFARSKKQNFQESGGPQTSTHPNLRSWRAISCKKSGRDPFRGACPQFGHSAK